MSVTTTPIGRAGRAPRQSWLSWRSILDNVLVWRRRARERADLARLSERELRDIGISAADVWREVNKPFWQG